MRLRRKDVNQYAIVRAFEAWGADVQDLSAVGGGFPDLLIGYRGVDQQVEVKRPAGKRGGTSFSELNALQVAHHRKWGGRKPVVVRTDQDVAELIRAIDKELDGHEERRDDQGSEQLDQPQHREPPAESIH